MFFKILSILLPSLIFHLAVWLFMASILLRCLELRHPETYLAMGGSLLRLRNGLHGPRTVIKFLVSRAYRSHKDMLLSIMSYSLILYSLAFVLSFIGLAIIAAQLLIRAGTAA